VCVGIFNRPVVPQTVPRVYTIGGQSDLGWLADIEGIVNPVVTPVPVFLQSCLQDPRVAGFMR
jgi:hypothetical protein